MNTEVYMILLLVSIILCIMLGTYLSYKAYEYESRGEPPDKLREPTESTDKCKQSKSNRGSLSKITVTFTFNVTIN